MTEAEHGESADIPGDAADGFDARYPTLFRVAYQVAFRLVGDRGAAEDIAQEALAKACARWSSVRRHPIPEAWVAETAGNLARNAWRADTRRIKRELLVQSVEPVGQDERDVIRRLDLHAALRALPRRQRQVLVLRYLADLPEERVAQQLGCSAGAVKQHAARALHHLRTQPGRTEEPRL